MAITRPSLRFEEHYVQLPNAWLRDERLSRRARGLLAEMMTHRVGWRITLKSLIAAGPEGRDAVSAAVTELREAGYLSLMQDRAGRGRFAEVEYILVDPGSSTANGFAGSGGTASWSTASGATAPGESAPKKEQVKEHHPEEDHSQEHTLATASEVVPVSDPVQEAFDRIWKVWPKKADKKAARSKFTTALKRVPLAELERAALAHAAGYREHSWPIDFVRGFAVWLNQDSWDNPVPGPRTRTAGERQQQDLDLIARYQDEDNYGGERRALEG